MKSVEFGSTLRNISYKKKVPSESVVFQPKKASPNTWECLVDIKKEGM
jgi:hypothetical protein